jgi:NAD(P)-dependent dehydrogenase (short-subunit alcohol dehydrogenase family)
MTLKGKTVVVTGAARGIGRSCALRFAREGAALILLDVAHDLPGVPYRLGSERQLTHTAGLCEKTGVPTLAVVADVRRAYELSAAVDQALDRFGTIDVLVNAAGLASPSGKVVHQISEDEWSLMLDVDLTGAWRAMKVVAPVLTGQRSGSVVNISSTAGVLGYKNFASYVAAKHGLIGLTKAAALDYAAFQVRVNAVCPGSVRDDPELDGAMLAEVGRSLALADDEYESLFVPQQPMNALVEACDVAGAAAWLAGDDARHVTGATVVVDGGYTIR